MNKERVASLRKRVQSDPYDAAAWEQLVNEADRARRGPERNAELAAVYEDLLSKFPTAAGYWREYADQQMTCSDEAVVKGVFSRCLLTCLSVDLWRAYLNFIKKLNEPRGAEGLPEIRQAYEFTLDRLGQDTAAGGIWQDYIAFLQAPRQGTPEYDAVYGGAALEGQEDSAKAAAVRRAYQRALLAPTPQLEALWRGYEGFEMGGSNKQLARRLLDEWRPRYQAARGLLRERESRLAAINMKAMALPPGRGGYTQQQQAALWRELLEWERGNPQRLDPATYVARVSLAFEQALMVLFHYPDIWLEFARWHQHGGGGGAPAALAVLEKGRTALPTALALHFAAADLQESLGNATAAKSVYEELVEHLKEGGSSSSGAGAAPAAAAAAAAPAAATAAAPAAAAAADKPAANGAADGTGAQGQEAQQQASPPAAVKTEVKDEQAAAATDTQQAQGEAAAAAAVGEEEQQGQQDAASPPPPPQAPQVKQEEGAAQQAAPSPPAQQATATAAAAAAATAAADAAQEAENAAAAAAAGVAGGLQLTDEQGTLAWVQYMRFAKRSEGIMAARKLFLRARKWPGLRWEAYAASAQMEWRQEGAKDTIPRNIFELGLKSHLGQPGLVLAYSQFLLGLGDIHNTRALFERALNATSADVAGPLWDAYLAFEYDVGSMAAAAAVEARRREAAAALQEEAAAAAAGAALDGKPAGAKAAAAAQQAQQHEALQLALLKYKVLDLWPASAVQRLCFERLLGEAPAIEERSRDPDSSSRRERGGERRHRDRSASPPARDRGGERERERRHRDRSPSPRRGGGGGGGSHAPRSPPRDAEPLRLSRELAQLMSQLPPPHALEGPIPDVERVVQVILNADLTPDGIIAHEVAAARERRRQRRIAEQGGAGGGGGGAFGPGGGGGAPGGPPGGGGGYAAGGGAGQPGGGGGPGMGVGHKRKAALQDYDSGSDSEDDDGYDAAGGGGGAADDGGMGGIGSMGGGGGAGLDVYRMRRKQQRA